MSAGRKLRRAFCAGTFCVAVIKAAHATPLIEWQVDNPFRFFQYRSDFEIQRWAYDQLSDQDKQTNPASAIERKLNNPGWWHQSAPGGKTYLEQLEALRQAEHRSPAVFDPRLGWASLLRLGRFYTCWNPRTQLHRDCSSPTIDVSPKSTYLDPAAYRVTAWLKSGSGAATCDWTAGSAVFISPGKDIASPQSSLAAPCDSRVALLIPNDQTVQVIVAGDPSGTASENIQINNLIIVGLGDSMASGEGNPDVPVPLDPNSGIAPAYDEKDLLNNGPDFGLRVGVPRRNDPAVPALWVDRRCHRSLYSWQARVALGIALTEPQHRSVTFLTYSCSGSEVLPGLLYPLEGREVIARGALTEGGRARLKRPQINAVIDELCQIKPLRSTDYLFKPRLARDDQYVRSNHVPRDRVKLLSCPKDQLRPIDLLLLDIGANDVGFSGLVANMMVTNGSRPYPGKIGYRRSVIRKAAGVIDFNEADRRLAQAKQRFAALHSIIRDRLKLRDDDESRVLFAAYPSLVSRTISGDLCLTGRATMTVSEIYEAKPETVIKQADSFTDDMLSLLKKYVEPWTYVTGHRNKFAGHGYCAVANDGPNESGAETAEVTNMPYMSFTTGPGFDQWQFYNPAVSLFPYESRARWFRTFNDDYMIINYSKTAVVPPGEPAEYNNPIDLAKVTLGGPMHPTAEGQAHIADAVIQEALSKLRAGSKGNQ